ncbi:MAG: TonB-dependent hemoglobin/transferrin/lactoferrin family receptor [Rhizobiales bacterium]|nr:TonB-dependent hemoglobin/transferrin/lactoferrin family receptor [Hyphomicrobiales bacterium]
MTRSGYATLCASVSILVLTAATGGAFGQANAPSPAETRAAAAANASAADEITVTATREERQRLDVPANVTVISRQQMDDRATRDIQDLVRYEPGVSVDRVTTGTDPWHNLGGFTIRGVTGNRVQIRVDGARVMERITDGTRDVVDLPYMKSVEIMRGPGSVLWGADALGGIVAFRTLDPDDLLRGKGRPWAARIQSSYDSLDQAFVKTGMTAIQFTPTLQGIFVLSQRSSQAPTLSTARADGGIWGCPATRTLACNVLDPLNNSTWNGFAKLVWRPADDHEWRFVAEAFNRNTTVDQRYDFGQTVTVSGAPHRNGQYQRNQVLSRQNFAIAHDWTPHWGWIDAVRWNVSYSPQSRQLDSTRYQLNLNTNQQRRTNAILNYTENFLQGEVQLTSRFNLGPAQHILTYGFQGDTTKTDYFRQDTVTNATTGTPISVTRGSGFNFANANTTRADLYLQDEISLLGGRWTITPGVRWANYTIDPRPDADYKPVPGATPSQITSSRFIPQLGMVFKLTDVYSVYARYAEGFKMPTAQQLYLSLPGGAGNGGSLIPNPNLRPESARSYEAGLRGRFDRGWFSVGAFHTTYKDFILSFQPPSPGSIDLTNTNVSAVTIYGVEASAQYRITDDLILNGGLSYQFAEQRATPTSAKVAFDAVLPLTATLGLRWFKREWNIDGEIMANFGAPITRTSAPNIYKPGGYAVFDSFINWRPTANLTFRAGVQNIFDTRYFQNLYGNYTNTPASTAVAQTNPLELQVAPGRTFKLSATADF